MHFHAHSDTMQASTGTHRAHTHEPYTHAFPCAQRHHASVDGHAPCTHTRALQTRISMRTATLCKRRRARTVHRHTSPTHTHFHSHQRLNRPGRPLHPPPHPPFPLSIRTSILPTGSPFISTSKNTRGKVSLARSAASRATSAAAASFTALMAAVRLASV
jgi:hypothetical protein